jgi:hypothetical protein
MPAVFLNGTADSGAASSFSLVHLYGSAYDMGLAAGKLQRDRVRSFYGDTWSYLESQVTSVEFLDSLPTWLADAIADVGLDAALDATYAASRLYTGSHFYEEMQGISDGSGVEYMEIVRLHMLAGLTQGKCSMFGAWGSATADGHTLQLRALDWDMNGPFRDYPQLTVYHPTEGHAFVTVGFTGFIGGLTGLSSALLGISEIGVSYPDATFGSESRLGLPFIYLLRDILQFDTSVDDAVERMRGTRRTCDLILGVGDATTFRGMEYSYSTLDVFDDKNMRPRNDTWHPHIEDVVYWGMDWLCPAYSYMLSTGLTRFHGNLTGDVAARFISAPQHSGTNHIALYNLGSREAWISFGAPTTVGGPPNAYARPYLYIGDVTADLFDVQHPSATRH